MKITGQLNIGRLPIYIEMCRRLRFSRASGAATSCNVTSSNPAIQYLALNRIRMANQTGWGASNEDTDARDMEALVQQPESADDYTIIDIHVPEIFRTPRKVHRLHNELRRKFNINAVIERPRDCNVVDVIRVEGYGIDRDTLLATVRRFDSRASLVNN